MPTENKQLLVLGDTEQMNSNGNKQSNLKQKHADFKKKNQSFPFLMLQYFQS